jgi:predicted DNA-binding protein with PD1-like motif
MEKYIVLFVFFTVSLYSQSYDNNAVTNKSIIYALRLNKGDDIKYSLEQFAKKNNITSGSLLTCVGSVQKMAVRFAMKNTVDTVIGPLEIVSVTGTIASSGVHIHIAAGDEKGKVQGGHLEYGTTVMMTAEIVIMTYPEIQFQRNIDQKTGFPVLHIEQKEQ